MKRIFSGKVLIAMVVIALLLLCGSLAYIIIMRPAPGSNPNLMKATSAITVIPDATATPRPLPPTLTPLPVTPESTSTLMAGEIAIGVYVQPSTGGQGLRVRLQPSLSAQFFSAFDSEVFQVTKGPEQADGHIWWFLTASYDTARAGWAAQDFLTVIPSP
jgi:hypothetical protein